MSELMDTLLADGKRLQEQQERRAHPVPVAPATRAEQIVAEGERRRVAYRQMNLNADTAMTFGAQTGYLHGQVKRLCNEIEANAFKRNPALLYETVWCVKLAADVLVGFAFYADGDIDVQEVVVGGADIAAIACESVRDQVGEAAMGKMTAYLRSL